MAEPKGMMMDAIDSCGNTVTIYSKTGRPYTENEYNVAMQQYNTSGKEPSHFLVLRPGATNWMRQQFEKAQEFIQPGLEELGKNLTVGVTSPLAGIAALAEKAGIVPPGYAERGVRAAEDVGGMLGRGIGGQVSTP